MDVRMLVFAHLAKECNVRSNGITNTAVFNVLNTVFLAGFLDDLADVRIVNVRDLWKQVMLDLEIQSTDEPAHQFIPGSEVGRCLQLVNSPLIFHLTGSVVRQWEMRMLYSVCKLENNTKDKASH